MKVYTNCWKCGERFGIDSKKVTGKSICGDCK